jgi:AI-2E family transporter
VSPTPFPGRIQTHFIFVKPPHHPRSKLFVKRQSPDPFRNGMMTAVGLMVAGLSGFHHLLWILLFLAVFRVFQDYVLAPRLLSAGTELHPLALIFGVLAGAQIAGITGSFLPVPLLATLASSIGNCKRSRFSPGCTVRGSKSLTQRHRGAERVPLRVANLHEFILDIPTSRHSLVSAVH